MAKTTKKDPKKEKNVDEGKFTFTSELLKVLDKFSVIGRRSPSESFVVVTPDKMKVIHPDVAVIATYSYEPINIEKSFALYDSGKLLSIINMVGIDNCEFKFESNNMLSVKAGKSKFRLYLADFVEKEQLDKEDTLNKKLSARIMMSDSKIEKSIVVIKKGIAGELAEFVLTHDDIKNIKKYQTIMKHNATFFSSVEDGILVRMPSAEENEYSDVSSFVIEDGIDVNKLDTEIKFCFDMALLIEDDYKVSMTRRGMILTGQNYDTVYICVPVVKRSQLTGPETKPAGKTVEKSTDDGEYEDI